MNARAALSGHFNSELTRVAEDVLVCVCGRGGDQPVLSYVISDAYFMINVLLINYKCTRSLIDRITAKFQSCVCVRAARVSVHVSPSINYKILVRYLYVCRASYMRIQLASFARCISVMALNVYSSFLHSRMCSV